MQTISRIIVSAVLISKDNKILLGKVREGGVYPDCWHIPGGGVDANETKQEALIREIKEEVGIDIKDKKIKLLADTDIGEAIKVDKTTKQKVLVKMAFNTYQVELKQNAKEITVSLDDDLRLYKWVEKSQLKNYQHTPPSKKLFTSLGWL